MAQDNPDANVLSLNHQTRTIINTAVLFGCVMHKDNITRAR